MLKLPAHNRKLERLEGRDAQRSKDLLVEVHVGTWSFISSHIGIQGSFKQSQGSVLGFYKAGLELIW